MKKRILGLMLIAGIVLALGGSAFAAASLTPTLSITKLSDGTAGKTYSQVIKATVSSCDTSLTISADTTLFTKYNFKTDDGNAKKTETKKTEASITLASEGLKEASKSGIKIKIRATNTHGGQNYITEKEFTLKISGTKAKFTSPTETDLGKAFLDNNSGVDTLKKGVAVVGTALPADKINITAKGTQPISMTAANLNGMTFEQKSGNAVVDKGVSGDTVYKLYGTPTKAGTFNIKVTAENTEVGKTNQTYKLTVLDAPEVTTTSLPTATFGKKYSAKVAGNGGTKDYPVAYYATGLPTGFKITSKDGKIEGTISKDAGGFTTSDAEKTVNVTVGVVSYSDQKYGGDDMANATLKATKTIPLTIKATKPVILSKDVYSDTFTLSASKTLEYSLKAAANADTKIVKAGSPIVKSNKIYVYASYPAAEITVTDAPDGVNVAVSAATDDEKKLGAVAKAEITVTEGSLVPAKGKTMTITAKNAAGSDTVKIKFNIDGAAPTLTGDLPSGNKNVNDTQSDVTLTANQESKWTAKKLPAGIKLTPNSEGTSATLGGKYTKAQESTTYEITVTSKATGKTTTKSADIGVFTLPEFTTKTLGTATTGKTYKVKVALKDKNHEISAAKITKSDGTDIFNKKGTDSSAGDFQFISKDSTLSVDLSKIPSGGKIGVYFQAKNDKNDTAAVILSLDVKGTAPKFTTNTIDSSGFKKGIAITAQDIKVSGTQPMSYKASIAEADAKKLGLSNSAITFTDKSEESTTKFKLTSSDAGGGVMNIKLEGTPAVVAKGLPLTIEVTNAAANGKWTKKVFKVDVAGGGVAWKNGDKKASDDWTVNALVGTAITNITLTISADKPYTIKSTPAFGKTTNGISLTSNDTTVTIQGTPTKAAKIPVTLILQNPTTKSEHKVKVTIEAEAVPVITSRDNVIASKDFTVGKEINIKPTVKPNKDLTWSLVTEGGTTAADLAKYGLELDTSTGAIKGTATTTTSKDKKYTPITVKVKATNSAGGESGTGTIKIGIKGAKFAITTKTIKIGVTSTDEQIKAATAYPKIATNPEASGVTWSVEGTNDTPITIDEAGVPKGNGTKTATKGKTLTVKANNVGTIVTGKIKVIAYDPKPSISTTFPSKTLTASKTEKVVDETDFAVSDASCTGETVIKWSITRAPEGISAKIKGGTDDNGKTATLTLTISKGYKHGTDSSDEEANYETSFTVRATNKMTGEFDSKDYTVSVNTKGVWTYVKSALPENKEALPEDEELTEDEETTDEKTEAVEAAEGVTLGAARTEASLTAGQRAAIAKEGYIIAAVLPEMTVAESGQYDLEVELYEKTPEGAKLVWFAFPQGVEASTDDEIAEFFDEAGADIETVPASRKIVVSPWLEAEVTYAPVIVVKAEDADGAKDSLEGAEAGDLVTEEALAAAE